MCILNPWGGVVKGVAAAYTKLCVEYILFNRSHNSRLVVLQEEFNPFPDKENLVRGIGETVLLGWHRAQTSSDSSTELTSGKRTGLDNTAVMLGQPRTAPDCAAGGTLPESY